MSTLSTKEPDLSNAELMELHVCSERTITRNVARGMPRTRTGSADWIGSRKTKTKPAKPVDKGVVRAVANKGDVPIGDLNEETTRLRAAQADREEIEVAVRRGELMERELVRTVCVEAVVVFNSQMDSFPGRMANELAAISDPALMQERLDEECRRISAAVAQEFRKLALRANGGTGGAAPA